MARKVKASGTGAAIPVKGLSEKSVGELECALTYAVDLVKGYGCKEWAWWGADNNARKTQIKLNVLNPIKKLMDCIEAFKEGKHVDFPTKSLDKVKKGV